MTGMRMLAWTARHEIKPHHRAGQWRSCLRGMGRRCPHPPLERSAGIALALAALLVAARWRAALLVDTVGLAAGVLIPMAGVMFSDQAHGVGRFTLDSTARTITRAARWSVAIIKAHMV
jgi:hypothetical protein